MTRITPIRSLTILVIVLLAIPCLVVIFAPRPTLPARTMYCSAPPVAHYRFPEHCIGIGW